MPTHIPDTASFFALEQNRVLSFCCAHALSATFRCGNTGFIPNQRLRGQQLKQLMKCRSKSKAWKPHHFRPAKVIEYPPFCFSMLLASYVLYVCVLFHATLSGSWVGWISPGQRVLVCSLTVLRR
jgi:hypothetical protein